MYRIKFIFLNCLVPFFLFSAFAGCSKSPLYSAFKNRQHRHKESSHGSPHIIDQLQNQGKDSLPFALTEEQLQWVNKIYYFSPPHLPFAFHWQWKQGPGPAGSETPARIRLHLWDKNQAPLVKPYTSPEENSLCLTLWMKMRDGTEHGTSPIQVTKTSPGVIEFSEIFFTMAGNWQLHLQLIPKSEMLEENVCPHLLDHSVVQEVVFHIPIGQ